MQRGHEAAGHGQTIDAKLRVTPSDRNDYDVEAELLEQMARVATRQRADGSAVWSLKVVISALSESADQSAISKRHSGSHPDHDLHRFTLVPTLKL